MSRDSVEPEVRDAWEHSRVLVGGRVRKLRLDAGLTQEALALESGLSRNVLIELERGRRSVLFERLYDLARALEVPITALVATEEGPDGE
ncbi:helix-turn-helix domain-containing protein [Paraoerskovia marina]